MGMFDTITIDYPFPEGYEIFRNQSGQTKSLDCLMDTYFIDIEGKLYSRTYEYRELTEEEKDVYRAKYPVDHFMHKFIPIMTRTDKYTDECIENIHADIEVFVSHPETGYKDGERFTVRMNNGVVQYIKREEPWFTAKHSENEGIKDIIT